MGLITHLSTDELFTFAELQNDSPVGKMAAGIFGRIAIETAIKRRAESWGMIPHSWQMRTILEQITEEGILPIEKTVTVYSAYRYGCRFVHNSKGARIADVAGYLERAKEAASC